jgi:hypothetical protein
MTGDEWTPLSADVKALTLRGSGPTTKLGKTLGGEGNRRGTATPMLRCVGRVQASRC